MAISYLDKVGLGHLWNKAKGYFVIKSGDTMTGKLTLKGGLYTDAYNSGALDLKNSNIDGVNSIYTADLADNSQEGFHFYRDSTHVDTIYAKSGVLYFVPNRELGTNGTSYSVYHTGNKPTKTDVGLGNLDNIYLKYIQTSLSSGGWEKMNGLANSPTITIAQNTGAANWNSGTYSSSMVFGHGDVRGLIDMSYNTPIVSFGGSNFSQATVDNPKWYFKLTGTTATIYNLDNFVKNTENYWQYNSTTDSIDLIFPD